MTKAELLQTAKPILFNTDMVRAILDGRKTVTRRVLKNQHENVIDYDIHEANYQDGVMVDVDLICEYDGEVYALANKAPYQPGDILYVRETWFYESHMEDMTDGEPDLPSGCYSTRYVYKASSPNYPVDVGVNAYGWRPSIHMPKEAARIFLRVKDVRVVRLQEMPASDVTKEGLRFNRPHTADEMIEEFSWLWNSTIKKSDLDRYGWAANPWVWVIEFEKVEAHNGT